MPPLMEMGKVGAAGKTYSTDDRHGCNCGKTVAREDQPAGVSPKPCIKTKAAVFLVGVLLGVDMAAASLENMQTRSNDGNDKIKRMDKSCAIMALICCV